MGKWRQRFEDERDRRYSDLRAADQRALQIKEAADATALVLAAELQKEKDERKNDVLARWDADRNTFMTRVEYNTAHQNLIERFEASLSALGAGQSSQAAGTSAVQTFRQNQIAIVTLFIAVAAIVVTIVVLHH